MEKFRKFSIWLVCSLALSSCSLYDYPNRITATRSVSGEAYATLEKYSALYVSRFRGRDGDRLRRLLRESFSKQGYFKMLDSFPSNRDLEKVGLLEGEVEEVSFWEIRLPSDEAEVGIDIYGQSLLEEPVVLGNIRMKFKFTFKDFRSNVIILEEKVEQVFQQYYAGAEQNSSRPDAESESDRISRLVFDRLAAKLNFAENGRYFHYELGSDSISMWDYLNFNGKVLLRKGARLAQDKNFEDAILTWIKVAYSPEEPKDAEALEIYLDDRANALFNIGQVYRYLEAWDQAAVAFSLANQTRKRLHYAQAWSDVIMRWIDEQKREKDFAADPAGLDKAFDSQVLPSAKFDKRLFLNPKILWPFLSEIQLSYLPQ